MEHVLNLTNPGKTGLLKRQTIKYCCNSALEKTLKNMQEDIFLYFLKCSIWIRKYFKQTSNKMKYLQATSVIHCYWLPSFDNNPADKEHKTSKEKDVEEVAVVAKFRHS